MEVETKYGWFIVTETTTGIMAEKFGTFSQFFIDRCDDTMMIQAIENEYETVHKLG
jgi:hypothetical protein